MQFNNVNIQVEQVDHGEVFTVTVKKATAKKNKKTNKNKTKQNKKNKTKQNKTKTQQQHKEKTLANAATEILLTILYHLTSNGIIFVVDE